MEDITTSKEEKNDNKIDRIRHSLAHVMAQAVLEMRPGSKLGFGPAIDDGFYYDFILSSPVSEEDFPEIEKRMKHIIRQRQKFDHEDLSYTESEERLHQMGEHYKWEYAKELFDSGKIGNLTFYTNGPFVDMCEGPHVENTGEIPEGSYKLRSVAGAYWRGDSNREMMTRIYAWAYSDRAELEENVKRWQEAQRRDHKKLGKSLDLYAYDNDIGKGLPLWLPNGTVIREELEKLAREFEFKAGYQRVVTPNITKTDLYYKTGHLPYYAVHMYPFMDLRENPEEGSSSDDEGVVTGAKESYALRPMICPHHHSIFKARPRSYNELPMRLAEYGNVYRLEDSGALSGLLRVRAMCMNDAHIYCSEDQLHAEFIGVMDLHKQLYEILGISDYYLRFSTWDPDDPKGRQKYVDDPAAWQKSQDFVRRAMVDVGLPFVEVKGEAAFYGPKIDMQFRTVTGREETASTNQIDFAVPARLGLTYTGVDNAQHHPFVIHRAPLGTHERFTAFLIELYGGAFPTWLAPVQVRVVTVVDRMLPYAEKIVSELRNEFVRAEIDFSGDSLNKKIRNSATQKIPNVLIVGEKEAESEQVTLRRYGIEKQETISLSEFKARLRTAISKRTKEFPDQA